MVVSKLYSFIMRAFPKYSVKDLQNMNAGQVLHYLMLAEKRLKQNYEFEESTNGK